MASKRTIVVGVVIAVGFVCLISMLPNPPRQSADTYALANRHNKGTNCVPCNPPYLQVCRDGDKLIGGIPAPLGNYRVFINDVHHSSDKDMCLIRGVLEITQFESMAGGSSTIEIYQYDDTDIDPFCGFDFKVVKPFPGEPERIYCDLRSRR